MSFRFIMATVAIVLLLGGDASAIVYYVDFERGSDENSGTAPDAAFKRCPGDPAAADKAKAVKLAPGDVVHFKGGVRYCGQLQVRASGRKDNPIVFDGNTKGEFGKGRAIIDGGAPITGWKRCTSADEAKGNPRWKDIFHAPVPKPYRWRTFNLCDEGKPLPVAQAPNPSDPFFQEAVSEYYQVDRKMECAVPAKVYFEKGSRGNSMRPLILVLNKGASAVVEPIRGGAFTIELRKAVTVTAVGIMPQPRYAAVKEVAFYGDGKELIKATLAKDKKEIQQFDLPAPATFRKLTVKLLSAYESEKRNWTAIARVAAYDAAGKNVLDFDLQMAIRDEKVLTQKDPGYYDGMWVGVHGGNNIVTYLRVRRYDPAAHCLYTEFFGGGLYNQTRYCFYNSVWLIDLPGEHSIEPTADPNTWRVYLMPDRLVDGKPAGIAYSKRSQGFALEDASHVVIQGFTVRRQGFRRPSGINVRGGQDVVIRECEVTLVNGGAGINAVGTEKVVVDGCYVHHNPGHTKGIVLRNCKNVSTRNCKLIKNTSTALDYYNCAGGEVVDTVVTDHYGMHANGLTFYLGCKNIVIERNHVYNSNIGLTIQDAQDVVIRNNILDAGNRNLCVGIWVATPFKNIRFLNNTLVRSAPNHPWQAAVFSNNRGPEGLVFKNNIIDGLSGKLPGEYSHNIYTQWGPNRRENKTLHEGELYEPDLKKIFMDPDKSDWRLKPGSPAIDAGTDTGVKADFDGRPRPKGRSPDIGAYEFAPSGKE